MGANLIWIFGGEHIVMIIEIGTEKVAILRTMAHDAVICFTVLHCDVFVYSIPRSASTRGRALSFSRDVFVSGSLRCFPHPYRTLQDWISYPCAHVTNRVTADIYYRVFCIRTNLKLTRVIYCENMIEENKK